MVLVRAEREQIEKTVEMSKRAFLSDIFVGGSGAGGPPEYDSVKWHEQMRKDGHLFQAVEEGMLIGAAILFWHETAKVLYVGRIFVDDAYHKKGYGMSLMNCVEHIYPQAKEICLETPIWNVRTNSFYKKLGYVEQKRDHELIYYKKTV